MIRWKALAFSELTNLELYELLKLRVDVFVVEQNCPYSDLDDKDTLDGVLHLIGVSAEQEIIACARLLPPGVNYPEPSIGRVIVREDYRKQGTGHQLIEAAIKYCYQQWNENSIQISAQQHLTNFYTSHGFRCNSEPYLEDGIPHIGMIHSQCS